MAHAVSDIMLSQLSEIVATQMGLHFPRERWRDLERGVRLAAQEFGFSDLESCIQWLVSSPLTKNQIEILSSHLTVGETYFFREKRSFEVLEEIILPELIRSRRGAEKRLRIWSTACATGEEPYSIAILLSKMIPDLKDWNIAILATDINPRSLQKAIKGEYKDWSFRDTPQWIKERFFRRTVERHFEILPDIKRMVTFSYLNLVEDAYPSLLNNTNAMDIVFCRNVLMYFTPERAKRVVHNLHQSLIDGGWLIVSPSEASQVLFSRFVTVNFPGTILYRKAGLREQEAGISSQGLGAMVEEPPATDQGSEFGGWVMTSPLYSTLDLQPQIPDRSIGTIEEEKIRVPQQSPYQEALVLYNQGCYAEATEKTVVLLSQNRDDTKAMALLARIYANQGKLAEALSWCEKAISADKLNIGLHYLRAIILQEQGEVDEAAISLKRALYLDQNFVLAHFALGNLALRQGKLRESDRHFKNALSLLNKYKQEELLLESEGMTAGRLMEIIHSTIQRERSR